MLFKRVTKDNDPMFEKAIGLYKLSFPIHEQREDEPQKNILTHSDYHFDLIYDRDIFIGIILYWENPDFIYVEHFAINPNLRNNGFGRNILNTLAKKDKTIILEIDPPIDEISIRRQSFYERVGFYKNSHFHVHPPYKNNYEGHSLVLMSYPTKISKNSYDNFYNYLNNVVMNTQTL